MVTNERVFELNYLIIHCDYMGILKIALDHFQRKVQTEECTGSTLV